MAPRTGFEPASLLQPTVFKTAPSPPGHSAYIGRRGGSRTHSANGNGFMVLSPRFELGNDKFENLDYFLLALCVK